MGNAATKESRPPAATVNPTSRATRGSRVRDESGRTRKRDKVKPGYQLVIDPSEMVDGGYLYPQGVYSSPQDFKVDVVRDVIIRRRLAPFYKGMETVEPNWTDEELLAAIDGKKTVAEKLATLGGSASAASVDSAVSAIENGVDNYAIDDSEFSAGMVADPLSSKSSLSSAAGAAPSSSKRGRQSSHSHPATVQASNRRRANTTSVTQTSSSKIDERNAQALWLYRNVHECPICFLMYPRLNNTRCCGQEICTECFVQIKRAPPHPPYGDPNITPGDTAATDLQLISEPACCPYCAMSNLGVIFEAPPFEWGVPNPDAMKSATNRTIKSDAMPPPTKPSGPPKPRRQSISHTHPDVVTTDQIRPDWESRLASARRKLARRAAAARRLHEHSLLPPEATANSRTSLGRSQRGTGAGNLLQLQFNMSEAQTRDLENRMLEEAIRQSLREV